MSTVIRNAPSVHLTRMQNLAKRSFAAVAGVGIVCAIMAVPDTDVAEAKEPNFAGYSHSTENYLKRQGCDIEPLRRGRPAICPENNEGLNNE